MQNSNELPATSSISASYDEAKISFNYSGVSQNTETHLIKVTEDKLYRILKENQQKTLSSRDWAVPFGVFLSISITFLTSSFKDFIIKGDYWQILFFVVAAITFFLTIKSAITSYINRPLSVNNLVDTIAGRRSMED
jgi:hypothetical protein